MTTLGERVGGLKRVVGGPFGSKLTSADYTPKGVPVIRGSNMEQNGRWVGGEFAFVSAEKAASDLRSNIARRGDIIVTQRGTMGQVSIIPDDAAADQFVISQSQMAISVDTSCASRDFVYYYLRSPKFAEYLTQSIIQTGVPHINLGILRQAPAEWPGPDVQEVIAGQLKTLDDKIELNRRMNETLEAMAQAIFRDWFVDFGPVRRKLAGVTDPVAIMGGLMPDPARAADLAGLFPDGFGEDELPVSWVEGSLARLALVNSESWKTSNHPAEVEYVDLSNTKWGGIETTARLTWEAAPSRARRIARKGDTIIGTVRPGNGSYAYIGRDGYTVSTGFAVLRPKQTIYSDAIYVAATAPDNITRLANLADGHGGAYPAVNPDVVTATPFPVVADDLLAAFSTFASPLRAKIEQAKLENNTLAETRDYLLPRLMSGEVRVGDVEAMIT